ncbi:MAG: class II aldolase/adducin family protein [Candidatus Eremiobacteraeota bacterium]|nr:class II aldolase/adducin family protein [Candidatus Eremiobacteraeota bacterium]MBV8375208.1 class II aldolase/adducin family protein [Candidatus Eremiobacteraeota bacterium]
MTERDARAAIVRCCARLWERRLVSGTSGNVSLRLDDGDILVTPAGRSLAHLAAADLVRVDLAESATRPASRPTSELPLHLAVYRFRADAACVVHTHPTFCVVWSLQGRVFPQETVGARETLGRVAWTPYRPNGSEALAELCGSEFARGIDAVLMERHGLTVLGTTLEDAFDVTDQAEEAARVGFFASLVLRGRTTTPPKGAL